MRTRGFSLVEMLVVIAMVVLALAMVVPLVKSMGGAHSIDAAQNQFSALLGRARARALGIQQPVGVLLFVSPVDGRTAMAIVQDDPGQADARYLDLMPGFELEHLPAGVGAQFLNNCIITAGQRQSDGYLRQPGLFLFDSRGVLLSAPYRIHPSSQLAAVAPTGILDKEVWSQLAVVFYDTESFAAQGHSDADPAIFGAVYGAAERAEETWLDQNAAPLLINRYNGTLVRTEAGQ